MSIKRSDSPTDLIKMPVYDESIFHPEKQRRALGIDDEDFESIVEYFRWHLNLRKTLE